MQFYRKITFTRKYKKNCKKKINFEETRNILVKKKKQWKMGISKTICNFTNVLSLPENMKKIWKHKNF